MLRAFRLISADSSVSSKDLNYTVIKYFMLIIILNYLNGNLVELFQEKNCSNWCELKSLTTVHLLLSSICVCACVRACVPVCVLVEKIYKSILTFTERFCFIFNNISHRVKRFPLLKSAIRLVSVPTLLWVFCRWSERIFFVTKASIGNLHVFHMFAGEGLKERSTLK